MHQHRCTSTGTSMPTATCCDQYNLLAELIHSLEAIEQSEGGVTDDMTTEVSLNSQQTGSGGLAPAVIVGVVIGLILTLVLGVAIVVVVLYLVRRRQEEEKNSSGRMSYGKVSGLGKPLFMRCCMNCS